MLWMWWVCNFFFFFFLWYCVNVCTIQQKTKSRQWGMPVGKGGISERRAFLSLRGERWEEERHGEEVESGGWCQNLADGRRWGKSQLNVNRHGKYLNTALKCRFDLSAWTLIKPHHKRLGKTLFVLTLRAGVILISSRIFKFLNSASEWSLYIYWELSLHLRSELFLLPLSKLSSDWLQLKKQKVWIAGGWRFCTQLQVSALIDTKEKFGKNI